MLLLTFIGAVLALFSLYSGNWICLVIGAILTLCGVLGSEEADERNRARANRQYYWAHYYDKDQAEAGKRMRTPEPVPEPEDEEDWIIIASALDDD